MGQYGIYWDIKAVVTSSGTVMYRAFVKISDNRGDFSAHEDLSETYNTVEAAEVSVERLKAEGRRIAQAKSVANNFNSVNHAGEEKV